MPVFGLDIRLGGGFALPNKQANNAYLPLHQSLQQMFLQALHASVCSVFLVTCLTEQSRAPFPQLHICQTKDERCVRYKEAHISSDSCVLGSSCPRIVTWPSLLMMGTLA